MPNYVTNAAYQTRTGYIPMKPDKRNQDIQFLYDDFNRVKGSSFYCVCDGHGANGHLVSAFIKDNLTQNICYVARKHPKDIFLNATNARKYKLISQGFIRTHIELKR